MYILSIYKIYIACSKYEKYHKRFKSKYIKHNIVYIYILTYIFLISVDHVYIYINARKCYMKE